MFNPIDDPTMTRRSLSLQQILGAAVLGVAASVSLGVIAAPHDGPPGMGMHDGAWGGGHQMERMLDRVNATPEQRTQIKGILDAARADAKTRFQAGRQLRGQMIALLAQPTIDANAAEALRQQQVAQFDASSKGRLQTMLQVANVLTPEQRQQLADYMTQRRNLMQRQHQEMRSLDTPTR